MISQIEKQPHDQIHHTAGAPSKAKSAVRQRKNEKRTSEAPTADNGPFVKTDITPEDFFKAWSRKKREALIDLLIEMSDAEAGDPDLEPSLASVEATNQTKWASGNLDDREGDGCAMIARMSARMAKHAEPT